MAFDDRIRAAGTCRWHEPRPSTSPLSVQAFVAAQSPVTGKMPPCDVGEMDVEATATDFGDAAQREQEAAG
jgi:hypothetical protein